MARQVDRNASRGSMACAALLMALVLAACASSSGTAGSSAQTSTTTRATATTASSTGGSRGDYGYGGNAGGGSGSGSSAANTVQQGAGGFVFSPDTLTVGKGESLTVSNVGTAGHTFTVTGQDIDVVNQPGQSQDVTIDLPPGTYPFVCRFHQSLGMKGTLTVSA